MITLTTARLRLRPWRPEDLPHFAAMNADPRVMEHFPKLLSSEESDRQAAAISDHMQEHGFGLWAVEAVGVADFVGFVGLSIPGFQAHFTPCVEVGWRLGMTRSAADDFDHPRLPPGHPLRPHVLYRLKRPAG